MLEEFLKSSISIRIFSGARVQTARVLLDSGRAPASSDSNPKLCLGRRHERTFNAQ
jgi:hypothetical protein